MANVFLGNAYNVLGLDTSASQKEIAKRSKDIINLIRIDEHSDYETDIAFAKVAREEGTVKDAVQRLSSPTKRIQEYFFWFDVENDNDEKALKLLQAGDIDGAISRWESEADKETATGFVAKKNLAVISSLLLFEKGQKKHLTQSIGYWKDLILSNKFWSHFDKLYALNDEVGTSSEALAGFRGKVTDELSDFYTDVSQKYNDNSFYSLFSQIFAVKGQKMQRDVLSPIYEAIHDASVKLENLNISEDNIISDDEIATLKRLTRVLQTNFDNLKDLGLYDDSASKTMRDKAAEALRVVALDLFNNLNESAKPVAILNIASKIAGTPATITRLKNDIDAVRKNIANEKVIKPINDLLSDEKYIEALDEINRIRQKREISPELADYINSRTKWCVAAISAKYFKESMDLFNGNNFTQAQANFAWLKDYLLSYIAYYDFDKESLDIVLRHIEVLTADSKNLNVNNIQKYRNEIIDQAPDSFKDQFEETVLIMLIDSSIYANLSVHIPKIKARKSASNWIWTIVIGAFVLFFVGISNNSSSSDTQTGTPSGITSPSSSNTAWETCSNEYDALKSQLESVEATMRADEAGGYTESYNSLVPQQNTLVNQVNNKATECNNLR